MVSRSASKQAISLLFGLTIFLSAFLLFQIQPMISKLILPWFGGSSAVWTTSMLFFQVLLLGGYAYAHFLSQRAPRVQGQFHLLILLVVLLWMLVAWLRLGTPVMPDPRWKPAAADFPVGQVLWVLAASVGVPYLLLSTTSSLVQVWYRDVQQRSSPYAFYALSNAASLLALLSYPVLFEPVFPLRQQTLFWSLGFLAYLLCVGFCSLLVFRAARFIPSQPTMTQDAATSLLEEQADMIPVAQPTWKASLAWIGLAACSSVMLLATTNHVTQDLTSAPFLWVLPLSLYLLSFVITFNDRQAHIRGAYVLLALAALFLGYINLDRASNMPILQQIMSNAVLLFVICLLCHAQLYASRPHPRYLTTFYLMVSIGGALGGFMVSVVAPLVFNDFWEYHLGLAVAALVAVMIAFQLRNGMIYRLRFLIAVAAFVLTGFIFSTSVYWINNSVLMTRNFYGVLRVRPEMVDGSPGFRLLHGGILHGSQVQEAPFRFRPTTYYSESTGVGIAYKNHPNYIAGKPMHVGVVGLGVGTMAAYGRPGDVIRFYEINPEVLRLARDTRYFSYLDDSPAQVSVVLGDARLSMEQELRKTGSQHYDLLVIDAFSGDSIPTHLLDREAIALYLAHLNPDGILAFHISNRHVNLQPVVALLGEAFDLQSALMEGGSSDWQGSYSVWVLLGSREVIRNNPAIASPAKVLKKQPGLRIWTDDYSNLIQVLRR